MKKRRVMLVLAGVLAMIVVAFLVWPGEREPEYQGKKLSWWLIRAREFNGPQQREAADAVRQIGSKAVPWLLMWTDVHDNISPWKLRLARWTQGFPSLQQTKAFQRLMRSGTKPLELIIAALQGFEILGPEARGAIPELTKRLNGPSRGRGNGAAQALTFIGKETLPLLLSALTNTSRDRVVIVGCIGKMGDLGEDSTKAVSVLIRCVQGTNVELAVAAIYALGKLQPVSELKSNTLPLFIRSMEGSDKQVAATVVNAIGLRPVPEITSIIIPVFLRCAEDNDREVAKAAIRSLGRLRAAPELVLPVLRQRLRGTDAQLRVAAMSAIGDYGAHAREAIPEVMEAMKSGDWSIRHEATNTLMKIEGKPVFELE